MLNDKQNELYNAFYESTHNNQYLDSKTEVLVGLSSAIALNCQPCTKYYLSKAKTAGIKKGEISEVIAKVMAVAAGQKRLQTQEVIDCFHADLSSFD
ncbi:MAG: carboxymuconolactone decarboxylase family protein [Gammaproteobacteria bacterium]|nr:carboxymuconolactone decarboxylase family protein [Gammaproteobacteria bacterium]